jgi:methionyl-tRNA formyltransferase
LARILTREDGRLDFAAHTAIELWNRWRGFQPWPGAFTTLNGKKLIIPELKPHSSPEFTLEPGELALRDRRLFAGCAAGTTLELVSLQPEGKNRMTAAEFLRGNAIAPGTRLG